MPNSSRYSFIFFHWIFSDEDPLFVSNECLISTFVFINFIVHHLFVFYVHSFSYSQDYSLQQKALFSSFLSKTPKQLYQNIFFYIISQFDQIISSRCLMLGMLWQFRKCSFSRAKKVSCSTKKCHKCRYIRLSPIVQV